MKKISLRTPPTKQEKMLLGNYPEIVKDIMFHRGIRTEIEADACIAPRYETGRHDPFLLPDMDSAVDRFLNALTEKEVVAIFSDYDADGIPGAVMFQDFFSRIGYTRFHIYIPHRHTEGYGLNREAIDVLHEKGVTLLLTVDCGIRDHAHIAYANEKGIDVIVTDHHEPDETLPHAHAVVNPKRTDSRYPFSGLCGTGVGFKFLEAVLSRDRLGLPEGHEKWFLDMVGLATLSDMVPLVDENRIFAWYGLQVLRKTPRPGLQMLYKTLRLSTRILSEDDIGFMITPRINAASRMSHPDDAFQLLSTSDETVAREHAQHIEALNNERKGLVASLVKEARKRLRARDMKEVIVIGDPSWRPAVLGLVAGNLAEEFSRPAFVWGREGGEIIKGSCRTAGGVSVVSLMEVARDLFIDFGGHSAAGGFSMQTEKVFDAEDVLTRALSVLPKSVDEILSVDRELSLDEVTRETSTEISRLAPFGIGYEKPLFIFQNVKPVGIKNFGKEKNHLELSFETSRGRTVRAIGFFMTTQSLSVEPRVGEPLNLLAHLEESFWNGRSEVRLKIVDVV